jgi:hypothetical protein
MLRISAQLPAVTFSVHFLFCLDQTFDQGFFLSLWQKWADQQAIMAL